MGKPPGFRRWYFIDFTLGAGMKYGERRVEFRFGNGRFVRPVPEKIKVIERQSGPVPQPPGKRALSRSRDSRSRGFFFMEV